MGGDTVLRNEWLANLPCMKGTHMGEFSDVARREGISVWDILTRLMRMANPYRDETLNVEQDSEFRYIFDGVELYRAVERIISMELGKGCHTVVVCMDDLARVPVQKRKEQKNRDKRNVTVIDKLPDDAEFGLAGWRSPTEHPKWGRFHIRAAMLNRSLRPKIFRFLVKCFVEHAWFPLDSCVILDHLREGAVVFRDGVWGLDDRAKHEFGEADLSMIYWLNRLWPAQRSESSSSSCEAEGEDLHPKVICSGESNFYIHTTDSDAIPILLHFLLTRGEAAAVAEEEDIMKTGKCGRRLRYIERKKKSQFFQPKQPPLKRQRTGADSEVFIESAARTPGQRTCRLWLHYWDTNTGQKWINMRALYDSMRCCERKLSKFRFVTLFCICGTDFTDVPVEVMDAKSQEKKFKKSLFPHINSCTVVDVLRRNSAWTMLDRITEDVTVLESVLRLVYSDIVTNTSRSTMASLRIKVGDRREYQQVYGDKLVPVKELRRLSKKYPFMCFPSKKDLLRVHEELLFNLQYWLIDWDERPECGAGWPVPRRAPPVETQANFCAAGSSGSGLVDDADEEEAKARLLASAGQFAVKPEGDPQILLPQPVERVPMLPGSRPPVPAVKQEKLYSRHRSAAPSDVVMIPGAHAPVPKTQQRKST